MPVDNSLERVVKSPGAVLGSKQVPLRGARHLSPPPGWVAGVRQRASESGVRLRMREALGTRAGGDGAGGER